MRVSRLRWSDIIVTEGRCAQFLEQVGNSRLPRVGKFLDEDTCRKSDGLLTDVPKSIDRLQRYRRSYYWVFQQRRNLVQLPGYISEHIKEFDPRQRWTQALVIDLAWLYLVTVLWAVDELTRLHVSEF